MSRAQARRVYHHSSNRGKREEDFFCLTPIGVRVGYGSPALIAGVPKTLARRLSGRVVWASTSNPIYAIAAIRPGATLVNAKRVLREGNQVTVGRNTWYLAPTSSVTAIFKARHGVIDEIGIAIHAVTASRAAQRRFLTSFS